MSYFESIRLKYYNHKYKQLSSFNLIISVRNRLSISNFCKNNVKWKMYLKRVGEM
ncbi:hypothetical protein SAMN04488096_102290 [Mesonia phycicola]|uniref:Uncharacterized protein n=1 Tax=Mesonia phycicola TaxID=579105 RepID=A0A1M6BZ33_9FLAO|nr:hypothetical protein SAMN04488096_102290 [Mesonia phycicola]